MSAQSGKWSPVWPYLKAMVNLKFKELEFKVSVELTAEVCGE